MNKGAGRKQGLVRITRQVHVDLDVFFIQARVLLVDCMLGVTSAMGGARGHTMFPGWATGGAQEAPGGCFAPILRRMASVRSGSEFE